MTIMSFEVKTVKKETKKYRRKNKVVWLCLAFFAATEARNLKNPTSSRTMDIKTIEKKITSI